MPHISQWFCSHDVSHIVSELLIQMFIWVELFNWLLHPVPPVLRTGVLPFFHSVYLYVMCDYWNESFPSVVSLFKESTLCSLWSMKWNFMPVYNNNNNNSSLYSVKAVLWLSLRRPGFDPRSVSGRVVWKKLNWDRFFYDYVCVLPSISFHQCSILFLNYVFFLPEVWEP